MLQHLFGVKVCDQKGDVISLLQSVYAVPASRQTTNLNRFPSQDKESLRPLRQKPRKFMDQDMLNLIGLLDFDTDSDTVDAWFDQDTLILIPRHSHGT